MSPNTALLPWSLCLVLALTSDGRAVVLDNATLLFDAGGGLRSCGCPAPVQDCDEALADSWCRCHSVPRAGLTGPGLRRPGNLTVWAREPWVLEELLNGSAVAHLRLAFCGVPPPLRSRHLVLLGLQTLRVHSAAPGAPFPDQEIRVSPAEELDSPPSLHMTFVDLEVLKGRSALKAYSVVGPPLRTFSRFFPLLVVPLAETSDAPGEESPEPAQQTLITFVY